MNAEEIILVTVKGLISFIYQYFGEVKEFQQYIKSWHETWPVIRNWLIQSNESIFLDKEEAMKNFMMQTLLLPEESYENIKPSLLNSFVIHETFWNQFFINILEAKSKLSLA